VTIEFALVVPLLFLFFFAAFEFSRVNMARHTADIAAYEGARRGMVPGATSRDAETRAQGILQAAGLPNATITVTPTTIDNLTPEVTVDISLPLDGIAWVTPIFFGGKRIDKSCTLQREVF
jgi:Flp pilus assembly protein TadG